MVIPQSTDQLMKQSYVESVSVPNQVTIAVTNPDGSNIVAGGGGGPVIVDQGTGGISAWLIKIDQTGVNNGVQVVSSALPTGAATEATLATRLAEATFTARINTLGQKTSANSTPVVLASDQPSIPVYLSGSSTALTPTSGQVVVAAGPTATALGAGQVDEITIVTNLTNTGNIALGPAGVTTGNGFLMEPGRDVTLRNVNLAQVFINGTAGEGVSWFATT